MRRRFIEELVRIAHEDDRILLLTGDLGYSVVEPFERAFQDRFFNVGVAEQNMIALACGLAEAGFIPFVYSIATFASLRPYEFIRNGAILHHFPVRMIAVGGGYEYGANGLSHHALEDIGVMRVQPGMKIVVPADAERAAGALSATWNADGPIYFRLGKDEAFRLEGALPPFEFGSVCLVGEGEDLLFVSTGAIVQEVQSAVEKLRTKGISAGLLVIESVAPEPRKEMAEVISNYRHAITVEAHYTEGGVGSMVAELIAEEGLACRLKRCGAKWLEDGLCGSQEYLQRRCGLDGDSLAVQALEALSQ